jgi:DNA-directed RNA polymerase subunit beta
MTPEEKLLRAIFGEKASDVRDTSLRLPPGDFGTVVEVRVFNRHGVEKDERALQIEREEVESLARDRDDEMAILERNIYARLRALILGKTAVKGPKGVKANSPITEELLDGLSRGQWWQLALGDEADAAQVEALNTQFEAQKRVLTARFEDKVEKVRRGDDLPPGVLKMVKVFIAVKRKLQPGDKMAGRHGNKGVVSKVVPMEDMPFLGRRHAGRPRSEPARRAEPDECRPDPGNPYGLGGARAGRADRRGARRVSSNRRHDPGAGGDAPGLWRRDLRGRAVGA